MSTERRDDIRRQRLAYEAARILAGQGLAEFDRARRKAAARLGLADKRLWPSNEEIQAALMQQQRLFDPLERRAAELRRLWGHALGAMRLFSAFAPRLVGPLLAGTGDMTVGIRLHLFAEGPEEVVLALMAQRIPWRERERVLGYPDGRRRGHPAFHFVAGGIPVELVVLPVKAQRSPPLDWVSERPEKGADLAEVERLVAENEAEAAARD